MGGRGAGAKGLTLRLKGLGIVEEVQPEIEQRCRDWLAIYRHVSFIQVPTARSEFERRKKGTGVKYCRNEGEEEVGGRRHSSIPHKEGGCVGIQFVDFAFGTRIFDQSVNSIPQVALAIDVVRPSGRI